MCNFFAPPSKSHEKMRSKTPIVAFCDHRDCIPGGKTYDIWMGNFLGFWQTRLSPRGDGLPDDEHER